VPAQIRKLIVSVDETRLEMGKPVQPPTRRALAIAVIANPYAGRYAENLDELIAIGEELGGLLGDKCVQALGIAPAQAESYGKAAVVGEAGELEHAAAILHPKLGAPLRKAVEKGAALVPSAKKMGGLGHADRHAAGPQGCRLRAQPLRCDRGARVRRTPSRRRSWSPWPSPTAAGRCRESVACARRRSKARMGCVDAHRLDPDPPPA
jgi:hypothetical protein